MQRAETRTITEGIKYREEKKNETNKTLSFSSNKDEDYLNYYIVLYSLNECENTRLKREEKKQPL